MSKKFDIIILGAGCAALNFAMAYAQNNLKQSILILEQKNSYVHDRYWSFWLGRDQDFPHRDILKACWPRWSFSDCKNEVIHHSDAYEYVTISSDDFYKKAQNIIQQDPRQNLTMGCTVQEITQSGSSEITTNKGAFQADVIIDTRNISNESIQERSSYYQIFYGYEITVEDAFFDEKTVGLMDNLQTDKDGVSFIYTLPFSKTQALVEYTAFTKSYCPPEEYEMHLKRYLDEKLKGVAYNIVHREKAVLPMGALKANTMKYAQNYIHAGGSSGALRESSGYGFLRLHNWSINAVQLLESGGGIKPYQNKSRINGFMDRHFVKTLKNNPALSAQIFMCLARRCKTDAFVRFMSEQHNFIDTLQIIWAVPKTQFLKALFQK
jgi:lycopene beta-cyclase